MKPYKIVVFSLSIFALTACKKTDSLKQNPELTKISEKAGSFSGVEPLYWNNQSQVFNKLILDSNNKSQLYVIGNFNYVPGTSVQCNGYFKYDVSLKTLITNSLILTNNIQNLIQLPGNRLLLSCIYSGSGFFSALIDYSPSTNTHSVIQSMPSQTLFPISNFHFNNKYYLFNNFGGNNLLFNANSFFEYNGFNITQSPSFNFNQHILSMVNWNGKLYIIDRSDVNEVNGSSVKTINAPLGNLNGAKVIDNELYLYGSFQYDYTSSSAVNNDIYKFTSPNNYFRIGQKGVRVTNVMDCFKFKNILYCLNNGRLYRFIPELDQWASAFKNDSNEFGITFKQIIEVQGELYYITANSFGKIIEN